MTPKPANGWLGHCECRALRPGQGYLHCGHDRGHEASKGALKDLYEIDCT